MRKLAFATAAIVILFTMLFGAAAYAANETGAEWLDTTKLDTGAVGVRYAVKADVKTKAMIVKDTGKYTYTLRADKPVEWFPLQLGNGDYTVTILENVSGNQYKVVDKATLTLALQDGTAVYLNQVQNIDWTPNSIAVQKAKELTQNKKTDAEKVAAVYRYVIDNVKYDKELAAAATPDYLPQIDRTFASNKDICYGYAALTAGMLRALDIPTKLVTGKTTYVTEYHAWNQVFLDGQWVTIDTTVDAGLKAGKQDFQMIKDAALYTTDKVY
ncbi:transglutaminase-like domain-containing protein [Cohnella algarum]|uniref:transglutaminase-like domain-containing protein n=1 Tax=Cohnella algarum TaxID=2044859 RepID=UPI001966FA80|nr:transglutaminase-like domain-containing protein [Cohnella algarum]MBN2982142.1 transglutaminase domain-containing protein [Cohnella algarum]